MSADLVADWNEVLDQIEAQTARAQSMIASPVGTEPSAPELDDTVVWAVPAGLGPLPDALRARAHAVLNRQQALQGELAEAIQATRAHLRVVDNVATRNAPQAVYIDTLG